MVKKMLLFTLLFLVSLIPLVLCAAGALKTPSSRKAALAVNIVSCFMVCLLTFGTGAVEVSADAPSDDSIEVTAESDNGLGAGIGLLGAALATGLSCIGAGIAVASSASAAIGAISENPKTFGKALIFVALAEGVALYGMLISIQILDKI